MTEMIDAAAEALLILATEPISEVELAQSLDVPVEDVKAALRRLAAFYDQTGRGFELRQVGSGWRYHTRPEHAETIVRFMGEQQLGKLTQAGLETLAVIAYYQPVSRSRIGAVRGVNVDSVVRTLITRNLVEEIDRDPLTGAGLLGTTGYFLERMGLTSLTDLPALAPNLPDARELDEELLRLAASDGEADLAQSEDHR